MARFQSVLDHAKRQQDAVRAKMAELNRHMESIRQEITRLEAEPRRAMAGVEPEFYEQFQAWCRVCADKANSMRGALADCTARHEQCRAELMQHHQRIRSLEALRERDREEAQHRVAQNEANMVDELALRTWYENQQQGVSA